MRLTKQLMCGLGVMAVLLCAQGTGKLSSQEKKSQDIATTEMKDMLQYGHLELADKVMAPCYIQHNPNVPQRRDGFKAFMSRNPNRKVETIKEEWKNNPAAILTSGDLVFMMFDREAKAPADPSKTYKYNSFDMLRVD